MHNKLLQYTSDTSTHRLVDNMLSEANRLTDINNCIMCCLGQICLQVLIILSYFYGFTLAETFKKLRLNSCQK